MFRGSGSLMAARNKLSHDYKTREKIKTTQLLKRLTFHALGQTDPSNNEKVELSSSQVKAIEILLKKTMPDLKQLEVTGEIAILTHEEWLKTLDE